MTLKPRRGLTAREVPAPFVEVGVVTGYRKPGQAWAYYFGSVFWLHNESMNIWTHGAACVALFYVLIWDHGERLFVWDPYHWPYIVGYVSCTGMFLASTAAHLLHSRSRFAHQVLFMVDYAGIGLFGMGTALPHLYYISTKEFFARRSPLHLVVMALLSVLSCASGAFFKARESPILRRTLQSLAIAAMYLWSMSPALSRYAPCLTHGETLRCTEDEVFWIHLKQVVSLVVAAFFYISRVPEKLLPGHFDVWGSSHQLFHVFIYFNMYYGALAAFLHMQRLPVEEQSSRCPSSLLSVAAYPLFVVAAETLVIALCVLYGGVLSAKSSLRPFKGRKRQ